MCSEAGLSLVEVGQFFYALPSPNEDRSKSTLYAENVRCLEIKKELEKKKGLIHDKFVREAMLIQEEETASGKPAAKARPILKPSSTSGWTPLLWNKDNGLTLKYRNPKILIVFKCQKFITRLLRHSKQVNREEDGGVHYDQVIDDCKKKLSDDSVYWSDEVKKQFANAQCWSIDKWISVLAQGGGQKQRFQY